MQVNSMNSLSSSGSFGRPQASPVARSQESLRPQGAFTNIPNSSSVFRPATGSTTGRMVSAGQPGGRPLPTKQVSQGTIRGSDVTVGSSRFSPGQSLSMTGSFDLRTSGQQGPVRRVGSAALPRSPISRPNGSASFKASSSGAQQVPSAIRPSGSPTFGRTLTPTAGVQGQRNVLPSTVTQSSAKYAMSAPAGPSSLSQSMPAGTLTRNMGSSPTVPAPIRPAAGSWKASEIAARRAAADFETAANGAKAAGNAAAAMGTEVEEVRRLQQEGQEIVQNVLGRVGNSEPGTALGASRALASQNLQADSSSGSIPPLILLETQLASLQVLGQAGVPESMMNSINQRCQQIEKLLTEDLEVLDRGGNTLLEPESKPAQPSRRRELTLEQAGGGMKIIQNSGAARAALLAEAQNANFSSEKTDGGEEDAENVKAFKERVLASHRIICTAYKLDAGKADDRRRSSARVSMTQDAFEALRAEETQRTLAKRIGDFSKLVQSTWGGDASGIQILRQVTSEALLEHEAKLRKQQFLKFILFSLIALFFGFIVYKEIPAAMKPYDLHPPAPAHAGAAGAPAHFLDAHSLPTALLVSQLSEASSAAEAAVVAEHQPTRAERLWNASKMVSAPKTFLAAMIGLGGAAAGLSGRWRRRGLERSLSTREPLLLNA